jgi:hypothetical protein
MPRLLDRKDYDGAAERIARLGLSPLWKELEGVLTGFRLLVEEKRDANGGAAVRAMIDEQFQATPGWRKTQSGDVDWVKCLEHDGARVCLGVEVQFSARSDLLIVDVVHLRDQLTAGSIDVGVLVVPSNTLGGFLTDRAPRFNDAVVAVERAQSADLPIVILALEHDGIGPPLAKKRTRQGR